MKTLSTIVLLLVVGAAPAAAEALVFDFLDYPDQEVGVPWIDQGLTWTITSNGDNPLVISTRYGLTLGTVVLTLALDPLDDVRTVETTFASHDPFTPARMFLYDAEGLIDSVEAEEVNLTESLTLDGGGRDIHWYRFESQNARLERVVVRHGAVAEEGLTWSSLKRLCR